MDIIKAMLTRTVDLKNNIQVKAVNISNNDEIPAALNELNIEPSKPVIVLVGGAGGIGWLDKFPMRKAIQIVSELAEKTNATVIDGGTQAGIMTEIGKQRKKYKFSFPLIGVVFDSLIMKEEPKSILDENHTNFIFIPGDDWGDESAWISKIATVLAGSQKSITILINGGEISQQDVHYSLLENRHVYIMRGTGRLADEITLTQKVTAIDIEEDKEKIIENLQAKLQ